MKRKRWADLSPAARSGISILATSQLVLAVAAWVDLARRPAEEIRGRKSLWAAAIVVNFVGFVAVLAALALTAVSAQVSADRNGGQPCVESSPGARWRWSSPTESVSWSVWGWSNACADGSAGVPSGGSFQLPLPRLAF